MIEPSPEWTPQERKAVALEIFNETGPRGRLALPHRVHDTLDRLRFLLIEDAEFLEANRKHILYGQP